MNCILKTATAVFGYDRLYGMIFALVNTLFQYCDSVQITDISRIFNSVKLRQKKNRTGTDPVLFFYMLFL